VNISPLEAAEAIAKLPPGEIETVLAQLPPDDRELIRAQLPSSGTVSLRQHLREVDPGPHLDWWHVGLMVELGQAVLDGEVPYLMIHMPRRYYKSRTIAQGLSSCFVRNHPDEFAALLFASDELAREHSDFARTMVKRAGLELRRDTDSKALWKLAGHLGGMWISTTRAAKVGKGWGLGIVDDPMNSYFSAMSRAEQVIAENSIHTFRTSAEKRRPPPALVLMHQRFGPKDPAGRFYERELDEAKALGWTVLNLPAEKRPRRRPFPASCTVVPDPRKDGEALCEALEGIAEIRKRAAADPAIAAAMDAQDPLENAGGGIFRASWFPIIGKGRDDLDRPVDALVAMAAAGEIPKISRCFRGHDFAAGGADAVASALLCVLEAGHDLGFIWCDPTEEHPAVALVEGVAIANAQRQGATGEQAIPSEVAIGKTFTARVQGQLQKLGFVVHLMPVGKGKVTLASAHAGKAAPHCLACGRLVVKEHERAGLSTYDLCNCETPIVQPGKVAVLAGPHAERFIELHADFDGQEGGDDHLVDAASAALNAAITAGSWSFSTMK